MNKEILDYYSSGVETTRLNSDVSQLEKARTQEIILQNLGKRSLNILDVGGGTGAYAYWLKQMGHQVHLIDPSPVNIDQAKKHGEKTKIKLEAIEQGVAENIIYDDETFDAVLFLGPLYHLTQRSDRVKALQEAKRVLKKGGTFFGAVISRYASLMDGFSRNLVADPAFVAIMKQDLHSGQHRNSTQNFEYFTTAFFHQPNEIKEELEEAGLTLEQLLPVESFGWLIPGFTEKWKEDNFRQLLLDTIRMVEHDESLLGISAHIIAVGTKE